VIASLHSEYPQIAMDINMFVCLFGERLAVRSEIPHHFTKTVLSSGGRRAMEGEAEQTHLWMILKASELKCYHSWMDNQEGHCGPLFAKTGGRSMPMTARIE